MMIEGKNFRKIIERRGIRTRDFWNDIHVTDWSATIGTGPEDCCWVLMGVVGLLVLDIGCCWSGISLYVVG
jgi:hypothetical protein